MRFILFGIQIMLREEEDLVVFGWDVFIQAIGVVMVNLHWLWESSLLDLLSAAESAAAAPVAMSAPAAF